MFTVHVHGIFWGNNVLPRTNQCAYNGFFGEMLCGKGEVYMYGMLCPLFLMRFIHYRKADGAFNC